MPLNLAFSVVPLNDAPTIDVTDGETSDGTKVVSTVDENVVGALLGAITISDPNETLTDDDITTSDDRFVVVTDAQGKLWLALAADASLDYETEQSVDVTLTVTDSQGAAARKTVTVAVHDIDEAPDSPTITASAVNFMIEENPAHGLNLAVLDSLDPEGDDVSFSVDNDKFEIEVIGTVHILKLKNDVVLDREATEDGTITINITASDTKGNVSDPTKVIVTILNQNEAPTGDDTLGAVTAGASRAATGNVNAKDVDAGDILTFTVSDSPTYGALTVNSSGRWTYTLDEADAAVIALAKDATLEDSATITISDGNGGTADVDVAITITGANEAPTAQDSTGAITVGGDPVGGNINAADLDTGDTLTFTVSSAPSYGRLSVTKNGGWTYRLNRSDDAVKALAKDATLWDTATITVTDGSGGATTADVTITITGINNAPTGQDSSGAVTAGAGPATGNVNATDLDTGDTLTFTVSEAATYGTLSVDASGNWTYMLDQKNNTVVALAADATLNDAATITITDSSGEMATVMVAITITGVNEAPTGDDTSGAVLKGAATPVTGNVDAADVDTGDTLTFTVSEAATYGTLTVDDAGAWTYTLNEENETVVGMEEDATLDDTATITITDSNGGSTKLDVSITVYESNDPPTIEVADGQTDSGASAAKNINENAAGLALGVITVTDANQTLDADNVTTSDARFVVKTDTSGGLLLALAENVSLDYETEPTVDVTVTVTDDLSVTSDATVTITVNDQNDPPDAPIVTPASNNFRVTENDTSGMNLADIRSSDPDGDSITFAVDNSDFEIETIGSAVLLKVKDGVGLDREATTDGTITIQVTATDSHGSTSAPTEVVITVVNVNEGPSLTIADTTFSIDENTSGRLRSLTVTDPEQTFAADDITLSDARFSIETDDAGALWLTLNEGLDAETETSVSLELVVIDDGGLAARTDITINITEVNEAPSLTVTDATRADGIRARSLISENDTGAVGLITITDPEDDLDATDITLSNTRFTTETDAQGRIWLMLDQAANYEQDGNTLSVTLTATDTGGLSTPVQFDLRIVDVNEAPTISVQDGETIDGVKAQSTIPENSTGPVGAITLTDPEETLDADDITLSDARFSVDTDAFGGLWLVLDQALDADIEESLTVTLSVVDGGGLASQADVTINVVGVNEVPTITVTDATRDDGTRARPVINENKTGAIGLITLIDPEETLDATDITLSNTRFATETDAQGRIWLMLDQAADYEVDGGVLSVTLTVTDAQGLTATSDVSLRVINANDPPTANQTGVVVITKEATETTPKAVETKTDLIATVGEGVADAKLDLAAMFTDQDGDTNFRYQLENAPDWFKLINVQYGADGSITGELSGTVPAGNDTSVMNISLVATDQDGGKGSVLFNIIVDDGNDQITDINLFNKDGTENDFKTVVVAENDASGVFIGTLTADDQDNPRHPNGQHTFTVAAAYQSQFEAAKQGDDWVLKVKKGVALDYEAGDSISLEVIAEDGGGDSLTRVVTVNITDNNDRPTVKNDPGNWWVTVDEDLDQDDITKGQWLTFSLETGTDALALFEDVDADDTLTYSIVSGPSWLAIDSATGALENKEKTLPTRGIYDVTVRATDEQGTSAQASFKIAVVLSDTGNRDNSEPDIKSDGRDIKETAKAGAVVGRITVEDEDLDVAGIHPWGDLTIVLSATADVGDQTGVVIQSAENFMDDDPSNDFFALKKVSENSDSVTYDIVLTEAAFTGDNAINAESYSEVDITVTAYDGTVTDSFDAITRSTDGADIDDFDFEIDDVNEAPALVVSELDNNHTSDDLAQNAATGAIYYPVDQQEGSVETIYLNLSKLFEDPDDDHDDGDFTFTASLKNGGSWLKFVSHWNDDENKRTTGPVKWEDIKDGADEDSNTEDDVTWVAGGNNPADDDYVLILEADRTGMDGTGDNAKPSPSEIRQDVDALLTIVATDEDSARSTTKIAITITDENLNPRADGSTTTNGVRISDTTPHEKQTITVTFDDKVDPDFTGAKGGKPVAVLYQVVNVDSNDQETPLAASVGSSIRYTVKQEDVDDKIQGKVFYYELFNGNIVPSNPDNPALETNTVAVADRQDPASGTFTWLTNTDDELVATVTITDPDGVGDFTYTWEYSNNGRGGWTKFDGNGDTATADTNEATIPSSVEGKFVRLVVTFDDSNDVAERVESTVTVSPFKVGDIDTVTSVPTIDAGGQNIDIPVGRTLRITGLDDAKPTDGTVKAEWIIGGKVIATGETFAVTNKEAGEDISLRITSYDEDGNVTSIVTADQTVSIAGSATDSPPIALNATNTIDLGAAAEEEGTLASLTATVSMSKLFEDVEGGLSFGFGAPSEGSWEALFNTDLDLDVFHQANGDGGADDTEGDQLLILDEATGAVRYYTTKAQNHDGDNTDGAGNWITSQLTATDASDQSVNTNLQFRIDVAPTGFQVGTDATSDPDTEATAVTDATKSYDYEADGNTLTEEITVVADSDGVQINQQLAARIDVQDQNQGSHAYGQYTFTVDDNRFEVVADTTDGSMGNLRLKTGQKLDFEAIDAPLNDDNTKSIVLVVTATPTPTNGNFDPITIGVTLKVENDTSDDPPTPPTLGGNTVPGLKDNEANDDDDETDGTDDGDDGEDDEDDGGTPAPMDDMAAMASMLDDGIF